MIENPHLKTSLEPFFLAFVFAFFNRGGNELPAELGSIASANGLDELVEVVALRNRLLTSSKFPAAEVDRVSSYRSALSF